MENKLETAEILQQFYKISPPTPSSASPANIEIPMSVAAWISGGMTGCIEMQPPGIKSRLCRFAGIPNQEVQGGHSQFNFGFIGLATLTPVELCSATDACKWFKEYMTIANTAG